MVKQRISKKTPAVAAAPPSTFVPVLDEGSLFMFRDAEPKTQVNPLKTTKADGRPMVSELTLDSWMLQVKDSISKMTTLVQALFHCNVSNIGPTQPSGGNKIPEGSAPSDSLVWV